MLLAFALLLITNFALSMLNQPDSVTVGIGVVILLAEVIGLMIFVPRIYRSFLPKKDSASDKTEAPPRSRGPGSGSALGLLAIVVLLPMFGGLGGCSKMIGPGYEGIKVNNYGGNRGCLTFP